MAVGRNLGWRHRGSCDERRDEKKDQRDKWCGVDELRMAQDGASMGTIKSVYREILARPPFHYEYHDETAARI